MGNTQPLKHKYYKVTWPDGFVSTFSHHRDTALTEEEIKKTLPLRKNGKIVHPAKVKRTK